MTSYKSSNNTISNILDFVRKSVCGYKTFIIKDNGRSKMFSESRRAKTRSETTSVSFILHIDLKTLI